MDRETEQRLLLLVGEVSTNQKNQEKRLDRLMDLLTPRIEKWDGAALKASALYRAAMTVVSGTIVGGIAFLFFK